MKGDYSRRKRQDEAELKVKAGAEGRVSREGSVLESW